MVSGGASQRARLRERHPGARCVTFGHLGDGNLHYNVIRTAASSDAELLASADGILRLVHDSVRRHAGSISAEQGIGQARVDELVRCKDPLELALMRRVKQALDPLGIMNPGKVFG